MAKITVVQLQEYVDELEGLVRHVVASKAHVPLELWERAKRLNAWSFEPRRSTRSKKRAGEKRRG